MLKQFCTKDRTVRVEMIGGDGSCMKECDIEYFAELIIGLSFLEKKEIAVARKILASASREILEELS